jgi:16S rRNA (guanine527-N7)-methyltransferase
VHTVAPFRGADHHHLYVYSKVRDTPPRYPRRAGMARKRPLSTKS